MEQDPQRKIEKIKILQSAQKNLSIIGLQRNESSRQRLFNANSVMAFIVVSLNFITALLSIILEVKTFFATIQSITTCFSCAYVFVVLMIQFLYSNETFECIDNFESLINTKLKHTASKSLFKKTNQRVEKLSKIIFFGMAIITPATLTLPSAIYSFINYFVMNLGIDSFILPLPAWFPFDWKKPVGYSIAVIIQYISMMHMFSICGCGIVLSIGFHSFFIAMSKAIKRSLRFIRRKIDDKTERERVVVQLIEFLAFHSRAKKLSSDFSTIYQPLIMTLFVWCLISITCALMMIQIQLIHLDDHLDALIITVMYTAYAFGILLVVCEMCQRITLAFEEGSNMVEQFEWYLFPIEIQRMLPMILAFTQQPIETSCFGSIACDRESFKYTVKTAYSYFTVIRKVYK